MTARRGPATSSAAPARPTTPSPTTALPSPDPAAPAAPHFATPTPPTATRTPRQSATPAEPNSAAPTAPSSAAPPGSAALGAGGGRDASIDAVRAIAIAGVVGGHWLVTGLMIGSGGELRQVSPLSVMPWFAPVSWVLQTLGLFFFAGGFAAARAASRDLETAARPAVASPARRAAGPVEVAADLDRVAEAAPRDPETARPAASPARRPGARRAAFARFLPPRLVKAVGTLVAAWALALGLAAAAGTPTGTLRTVAMLVISPLWFLLPYLALSAVTRPLTWLVDRAGPAVALVGVAVVAATDLGRLPGWLAIPAAWSVPWVLGVALARGRLGGGRQPAHTTGRTHGNSGSGGGAGSGGDDIQTGAPPSGRSGEIRTGAVLAGVGAAALLALVIVAHYPVSAVGVPGDGRSNLDPPSLFAVALAAVQIGLVLILRRPLGRLGARPAIAGLNRSALPIYLSHQSVLIVVAAAAALLIPAAPGLLTEPTGPAWAVERLPWLPVLAGTLALIVRSRPIRTARDRRAGQARPR